MVSETDLGLMAARLVAVRQEALQAVGRWLKVSLPPRTEADRLARLRTRALPPASCGPDMPAAPARGPLVAMPRMAMVRTEDGYDLQHIGHRGRDAARARDAFDLMADQARRAGGHEPFTATQKLAGRAYATLVDRQRGTGIRCGSAETLAGSDANALYRRSVDQILIEAEQVARMQAAIGEDWALEVTRKSKRRREPITVRELVDRVCLGGETIGDVLKAAGWSVYGETRGWAQRALAEALDRVYAATSFRGLTS